MSVMFASNIQIIVYNFKIPEINFRVRLKFGLFCYEVSPTVQPTAKNLTARIGYATGYATSVNISCLENIRYAKNNFWKVLETLIPLHCF